MLFSSAFRNFKSCKKMIVKNKIASRMIKQLLNSVFAKYRDLSVSRRSITCLYLWHRQIIDLLAVDKLRSTFCLTPSNNCLIFTEPEMNNCFSIIFRGEYEELEEN